MYQLLIFCGLLLFSSFSLSAQIKVFETQVGWKSGQLTMSTISDKTKTQTCSILCGPDSVLAWYFGNLELEKPILGGWSKVKGESLVGGFIRNAENYLFLENEEKTSLRVMRFNPITGQTDEHTINVDFSNEFVVDQISGPDRLLYFTVSKKKKQVLIYDFYCDSAFRKIVFQPTEDVWLALNNGRVNKGRTTDIKFVNADFGAGPDIASRTNKIYLQGNSVFLVIDPSPRYTRIFELSLESQTINEISVFHKAIIDPVETSRVNHNSVLVDNRLYYACATQDSFLITCYRLPEPEILFEHRYSAKDIIDFKSSELVIESGAPGNPASTTDNINSTRKYLRSIISGNLFLSVEKSLSGIHNLTIGSYKEINGGGGRIPGTSTGSFVQTSLFQLTYFNVLINPVTGTRAPGVPNMSTIQRAELFSKSWKEVSETENIFKKGDNIYYTFYDQNSKRIIFARL